MRRGARRRRRRAHGRTIGGDDLDSRRSRDENVAVRPLSAATVIGLFTALVVAPAAGCRHQKRDDAPCATVASRMFVLTRDDLGSASVDPATRRAVSDQLPAMRDSLTQICTDGKWSTQVRNCMANAPDHVAIQACQQGLTDEQRRQLELASRGETTPR
jgi:hypothetical protein